MAAAAIRKIDAADGWGNVNCMPRRKSRSRGDNLFLAAEITPNTRKILLHLADRIQTKTRRLLIPLLRLVFFILSSVVPLPRLCVFLCRLLICLFSSRRRQ